MTGLAELPTYRRCHMGRRCSFACDAVEKGMPGSVGGYGSCDREFEQSGLTVSVEKNVAKTLFKSNLALQQGLNFVPRTKESLVGWLW